MEQRQVLSKAVYLSKGTLFIEVWQTAEREGRPNTVVSLSVGNTRVHTFNYFGRAEEVMDLVATGLNTWGKLQSFLSSRLNKLMMEANSLDVKRYYISKQINDLNQLFQIG